MKRKLMLVVLVASVMSGCIYMPSGFSPSSTPVDNKKVTVIGHAEGSTGYFSLLSVIPFGKPDYEGAIKEATAAVPDGSALINVRAYTRFLWVVVGHIQTLYVQGDVVRLSDKDKTK